MTCKKNSRERSVALAMFFRLHRLLQLQAGYKGQLSPLQKRLLNHAFYTTYLELTALGHKKAMLWYFKRRPKTILFLRDRRQRAKALKKLEEAAAAYLAARRSVPRRLSFESSPVFQSVYNALKECWEEAMRLGLEKEAKEMLVQMGFNSKLFRK